MSRLILGFDIDGVLTNDDDGECSIWLKEASEYFGVPLPEKRAYYIEDAFGISREEVLGFFRARVHKIYSEVPVREHVAETLQSLWNSGHTIHLITARDESSRDITEKWLRRHSLPYHSLYMHRSKQPFSKGTLCQELQVGFFVDDKVENALETAEKGIYTLLFHASHNRGFVAPLPLVKNWREIQRHINLWLGYAQF